MSISSQFTNIPSNGVLGQVTAANANRDGTGTVVSVFTAGLAGARIERVSIKAIATTTAGIVRLFIKSGATLRLIHEELVTAIVPSATLAAFVAHITGQPFPLILAAGNELVASTEKAEAFNINVVEAGHF